MNLNSNIERKDFLVRLIGNKSKINDYKKSFDKILESYPAYNVINNKIGIDVYRSLNNNNKENYLKSIVENKENRIKFKNSLKKILNIINSEEKKTTRETNTRETNV